MGHEYVICQNKNHHDEGAQTSNKEQKDQLFLAPCFLSSELSEIWLTDGGCPNPWPLIWDFYDIWGQCHQCQNWQW